jgi:4a-hydroxytetrahydrobiopterin dehydratase
MRLNEQQITERLAQLQGWARQTQPECISKSWMFDSFRSATAFFAKAAELAEQQNHHPEFLSLYTHMQVRLWTHDASGLTDKDFDLALALDHLVEGMRSGCMNPSPKRQK